jgi:hypothetical protein
MIITRNLAGIICVLAQWDILFIAVGLIKKKRPIGRKSKTSFS